MNFRVANLAAKVVIAGLIIGLVPIAANAAGSRGSLNVGAQILPVLRVKVLSAVQSFSLTLEAARQGLATVPQAAMLEIFCNQNGYRLQFDIVDPDVLEVEVDGLEGALRVGRNGQSVFVARGLDDVKVTQRTFSYRVRYAPGVNAGSRPTPLRISAQNV